MVRSEDVEAAARARNGAPAAGALRLFRGEPLDPDADWDGLLDAPLRPRPARAPDRAAEAAQGEVQPARAHRQPLARSLGPGPRPTASARARRCTTSASILGDVKVGRHCWVGPYTVLDGLHADLTIGDYVDIGSSAQIYTHNTIERSLTGHRAPLFAKATTIGNCCFIAPQATIAPGTVIGDHCFVAAGSYVEGVFPPYSYIAGNPAKVVGTVEIQGNRARIRPHRGDRPAL